MFHRPSHTSHSALLFQTPESGPHTHHHFYHQHPSNRSQPPHAPYTAGPGTRPPPVPPREVIAPPSRGPDPVARELKTVSFPRDCLNRFTSIASINTARNRETCGLLLGKDNGGRFVVTTLLIPKQHSTSDTCAMDGEELVMQFTEERSLITLGWIHTHPTQSCFMSSVDLHTHSGFQRMLPESFAVVCAPNSTPNFGIFRLTDPPGLQTILECQASEAFHPHPERPIYTDADKGHVQIRDLPLEIVDLR
ncbi:Mov34-domain-containing protein [Russula ochroleuca]|jgi:STAM-binding protein|uniref:Mov34-domain-containing protein n=1 Tax=Russula ochroleuca TaxID=152965 RepID=A0A9P5MSL5_9AGAM|nr:Mov34-domain-containing protein [Russula ochroleuca]